MWAPIPNLRLLANQDEHIARFDYITFSGFHFILSLGKRCAIVCPTQDDIIAVLQ